MSMRPGTQEVHSKGGAETVVTPLDQRLRRNNFDLLRFAFAFVVLLVHAQVLSGSPSLEAYSHLLSSQIAVQSFFVVSGFLIFMSYENSRGIRNYIGKRIRRIYPAYVFVVIVFALAGFIFSSASWHAYFSLPLLKYLIANLAFLNFVHPDLPGLFQNNLLHAVNGALWTLKIEVMFYVAVPIVVMAFARFGKFPVFVFLYVASITYSLIMAMMAERTGLGFYWELQRQLPGQLCFFIVGALGYYYFQHLDRYAIPLVMVALICFLFQDWLPWMAIQPLALGILVVVAACIFPYVGNFGRYGDFSYGIYIVHFPILQLLIEHGVFARSPWLGLLAAILLAVAAAILLWHFVEKRFLRRSSHYVTTNKL